MAQNSFVAETNFKNVKHKYNCRCKKQRIENLIHAFIVDPLIHHAHIKVLPTPTNTASKSCRFISVCKKPSGQYRQQRLKRKFLLQVFIQV